MYEYHTLPNGIKIILSRTPSKVLYSGVYINVGSRDEVGDDEGMAHFIEHTIFKGTEHRRAHHILNRIDGVGGELSAFTTREETCLYATSLVEHLPRCMELFADMLFHSTFPEAEVERERDVVLEEINTYNDIPAERIGDQFEEMVYEGHPIAHPILGSKRNVRHFTSERLRRRMEQCYTPSRMVVSVVGDVEMGRLVRLCERHFGGYADHKAEPTREERPVFRHFERRLHRHTHQSLIMLGCEAPDLYSRDKTAFTLLNNILGGPAMNSRLNIAVREHHGFCYTIESQYVPYCDTGLFYIYAGVDPHAEERTLRLVGDELDRLASTTLSERELHRAARQMAAQMAIAQADGSDEMQSIGKAYLSFDKVDTLEDMTADIMSVTADSLRQVAERCFAADRMSVLIHGN